jgi:hypothetical protein
MAHPKTLSVKKMVWRMNESAPKGPWVDPSDIPMGTPDALAEVIDGGAMMSVDLRYGLDVSEIQDTVPGK